MIQESHKIKQSQSINLSSSVVSIATCHDFIAAGCLDDSIRIWKNLFIPAFDKQPIIHHTQSISGISDVAFKHNSTHFASLSIDSLIKVWDLDTKTMTSFQAPTFVAWKIAFVGDSLVSCGDLGKIYFYDINSREVVKRVNLQDSSFLTTVKFNQDNKKIAVGTVNGGVYILNNEGKQEISLKPHHKTIRQLLFSEGSDKIFTCSDDTRVAFTDIATGQVIEMFEGHKQRVNTIKNNKQHPNLIYSGSSDKTIKLWDIRTKKNIHTYIASEPVWSMDITKGHLLWGGQLGTLQILTLQ